MESSLKGTMLSLLILLVMTLPDVDAKRPPFKEGPWKGAHITFYGGSDGSGTYQGACGYGDSPNALAAYGVQTAAVNTNWWSNAAICGSCFEIKCQNSQWCKNSNSITVTISNLGAAPDSFDLPQPAFRQIAQHQGGKVPIQYRRVPCKRQEGIRFTISKNSNPYFLLVLIWNVGGAGDLQRVQVKGSDGRPWREMRRNSGQQWEINDNLSGQSITFRVKASDGRTSTSWHIAPKNWQPGQTYVGKNFK
ncbi:hypothetical protein Ancab_014491 [Ancistrocladus abbreviatus]